MSRYTIHDEHGNVVGETDYNPSYRSRAVHHVIKPTGPVTLDDLGTVIRICCLSVLVVGIIVILGVLGGVYDLSGYEIAKWTFLPSTLILVFSMICGVVTLIRRIKHEKETGLIFGDTIFILLMIVFIAANFWIVSLFR